MTNIDILKQTLVCGYNYHMWKYHIEQRCVPHKFSILVDGFQILTECKKKLSRFCTKALIYLTKANAETYSREWLMCSTSKGQVYCFVCKIFSKYCISCYSILSKLMKTQRSTRMPCLTDLTRNLGITSTSKLDEQIKSKHQYWRNVRERIIAVICSLSDGSLSFRGDNELFGCSNYFGRVAKFDPFILTRINRYRNFESEFVKNSM